LADLGSASESRILKFLAVRDSPVPGLRFKLPRESGWSIPYQIMGDRFTPTSSAVPEASRTMQTRSDPRPLGDLARLASGIYYPRTTLSYGPWTRWTPNEANPRAASLSRHNRVRSLQFV